MARETQGSGRGAKVDNFIRVDGLRGGDAPNGEPPPLNWEARITLALLSLLCAALSVGCFGFTLVMVREVFSSENRYASGLRAAALCGSLGCASLMAAISTAAILKQGRLSDSIRKYGPADLDALLERPRPFLALTLLVIVLFAGIAYFFASWKH